MIASQRDIAENLGLSQMTVSRALRGENGISEATRQQVLEAARLAGFPLPPSKKIRDNREQLHVLCTITAEPSMDSPFHGLLLDGFRYGARECASEVINCPRETKMWPLIVNRKQVDGVVVVWGDEHNVMPCGNCAVPVVYVFHGPLDADVVDVDNFDGGLQLGRHLALLGHRRVAFLGPDSKMALERFLGLQAGIGFAEGDTSLPMTKFYRCTGGSQPNLVDGLFDKDNGRFIPKSDFTAIMAYNDEFAVNAVQRLQSVGIRVPEDISVVGFDGISPAFYHGPEITTCAIPVRDLGAEAARLLYWRLEHPNAIRRKLVLGTELVPGKTVGKRQ